MQRDKDKITIRKMIFIKDDVSRFDDMLHNKIETLVSLMVCKGTKINASNRSRKEFMRGGRGCVKVTQTPEDSKVIILWKETK